MEYAGSRVRVHVQTGARISKKSEGGEFGSVWADSIDVYDFFKWRVRVQDQDIFM